MWIVQLWMKERKKNKINKDRKWKYLECFWKQNKNLSSILKVAIKLRHIKTNKIKKERLKGMKPREGLRDRKLDRDRQTNGQRDRQTNGQRDRQTNGQTDRQTDGQTDS